MTCNPATGARVSHYYVAELVCGTTPANPAWTPIRFTGGNLQLTKDSLQSAELDGSREIADIRLGQNQVQGTLNIELSPGSYGDIIAAALGTVTAGVGATEAGISVTITSGTSTLSRLVGDFTTKFNAGDVIYVTGYTNAGNNGAFYVVSVSALSMVVASQSGRLTTETASIDISSCDYYDVGTDRQTFSILTHYADADDGAGEYHLYTGCEITGYSFDVSANANVTGSFTVIGRGYSPDAALPSGSTFNAKSESEIFAFVDGRIYQDNAALGLITSASINLDNAAQAQFAIGSDDAAFIERGRANTTLSLSSFFVDSTLLNKFVNEDESTVVILLDGNDGVMAFVCPRVVFTTGTPDVSGEASIVQNFDVQALKPITGSDVTSSVRIYDLSI